MPRYRVRPGAVLSHQGAVLEEGAVLELTRIVADDPSVRGAIEEIDASGLPVLTPPPAIAADIARFKAHEQVTLLEQAIAEHKARGAELEQLLVEAKRQADAAAPRPDTKASPKGKTTEPPA